MCQENPLLIKVFLVWKVYFLLLVDFRGLLQLLSVLADPTDERACINIFGNRIRPSGMDWVCFEVLKLDFLSPTVRPASN